MELLGARIKQAREAKKLSQEQLASLCGVSGSAVVSNWEIGRSEPAYDYLAKLAVILDMSPNYFLGYEDPNGEKEPEPYIKQLINDLSELGVDFCNNIQIMVNAEKMHREATRKLLELNTSFTVQQPLFLDKEDLEYKNNKQKVKELAKKKADRGISDMQITEYLWAAGFGNNIVCADVMGIFLRLKVPSTQLITYIEAYLDRKFKITLD